MHCTCSPESLLQRIVLFKWDYSSANMLQVVIDAAQLEHGCILEVVLATRNEKPLRAHDPKALYTLPTNCN